MVVITVATTVAAAAMVMRDCEIVHLAISYHADGHYNGCNYNGCNYNSDDCCETVAMNLR